MWFSPLHGTDSCLPATLPLLLTRAQAPEILRYERYDAKADLWSVGAILYEMVYGRPPYQAANHIQLQKLIDTSPTPPMPTVATAAGPGDAKVSFPVSELCISLLQSLLRKDPLQRISFEEFFTHPLLQDEASANQPSAGGTYSLPIRKGALRDAAVSHSGDSLYDRSVERGTPLPELNVARSLSSLGSSTASMIPPFARLKVGTPPSRVSSTPKSSFGTAALLMDQRC